MTHCLAWRRRHGSRWLPDCCKGGLSSRRVSFKQTVHIAPKVLPFDIHARAHPPTHTHTHNTHTHTHLYVWTQYMHTCLYTLNHDSHTCIQHECMRARTHVYTPTCTHPPTLAPTPTPTYIHTYIHTYTNTHIQPDLDICTCVPGCFNIV